MALTAGTRVGPSDVTASIGAGGMGEVYRATDTRLKRDVAIRVFPAARHIHGLEDGPAEAGPYVPGDRGVRLQPDLTLSPTITSPGDDDRRRHDCGDSAGWTS